MKKKKQVLLREAKLAWIRMLMEEEVKLEAMELLIKDIQSLLMLRDHSQGKTSNSWEEL